MEQCVVAAAADHPDDQDLDAQLLARVRRLDGDAFHLLYDRHYGRLARFVGTLTYDAAEAEEIINDTLWFVWTRARELPQESRVSPWITRLAYRHCLRVLSRVPAGERRRRAACAGTQANAERGGVDRQSLEWALAELPLKDRLLMALAYSLGRSCHEMAEILEWPVPAVKVRMYGARRRLNRILARDEARRTQRPPAHSHARGTINNTNVGINTPG